MARLGLQIGIAHEVGIGDGAGNIPRADQGADRGQARGQFVEHLDGHCDRRGRNHDRRDDRREVGRVVRVIGNDLERVHRIAEHIVGSGVNQHVPGTHNRADRSGLRDCGGGGLANLQSRPRRNRGDLELDGMTIDVRGIRRVFQHVERDLELGIFPRERQLADGGQQGGIGDRVGIDRDQHGGRRIIGAVMGHHPERRQWPAIELIVEVRGRGPEQADRVIENALSGNDRSCGGLGRANRQRSGDQLGHPEADEIVVEVGGI